MLTGSGSATRAPRLSRTSILDACLRVADAEGADALTLRRVGAELGVDPTALYRHFRDKAELFEAIADRLLDEVVRSVRMTGEWRRDLTELALSARRAYLTHPRLAHILAASPDPLANNQRLAEMSIGALRAAGLTDEDSAMAFEVWQSYVAGASSLDAEVGRGVEDRWRRAFAVLDPDEFPNSVMVSRFLYPADDRVFRLGLDLLLQGIEARAGRPTSRLEDTH